MVYRIFKEPKDQNLEEFVNTMGIDRKAVIRLFNWRVKNPL
jgi:hypothetical protein